MDWAASVRPSWRWSTRTGSPASTTWDEFFALGETLNRVELVDGSRWVSPAPSKRHQHIAFLLAMGLYGATEQAGLLVLQDVNLRLAGGRILQPDLLVADTDDVGTTVEAVETKLVVEVVSPSKRRNRSVAQASVVCGGADRLVPAGGTAAGLGGTAPSTTDGRPLRLG
jgi:Uma2 family endonuclease